MEFVSSASIVEMYHPMTTKKHKKASGARRREDGSPAGPRLGSARLGSRQPSPQGHAYIQTGKPLLKKEHQVTYRKNRMLMYVGMTRPTHLLCLAIRTSALGEGEARAERRAALEAQGWVINELGARERMGKPHS